MGRHSFATTLALLAVQQVSAEVDCDALINPAIDVDTCKAFPIWADAMAENGDYGWHVIGFESQGYLLNMLHINKDAEGNELVDNINFPPLLMVHDFTKLAVDFFYVDDDEPAN